MRAVTGGARLVYAAMKAVSRQRRKVVFLSRQSDTPSRDLLLLADELRAREPGLEIVMRCRMIGDSVPGLVGSAAYTLRQMADLATARVCVIDGYVVPVSVLDHRPGLSIIQMWHALGAIKRFGLQTLDCPVGHSSAVATAMHMHENYDYVLCSGAETVPAYAAAFGVSAEQVRMTGLPRIDELRAHAADRTATREPASVAALRRRFPLLRDRGRTTVLYAPTLRRGEPGRSAEVVERFAGTGCTLIVKPHPLESADVSGPHVVNATGVDVLDLLPLCDVVITDYSAVAFEAAVLGLPVLFWVYDIDEYRERCGLNLDPLEVFPDDASRDLEPLAQLIEAGALDGGVSRTLRERYVSTLDDHCTSRVADLVFECLEGV